jgi:hypothetical protein
MCARLTVRVVISSTHTRLIRLAGDTGSTRRALGIGSVSTGLEDKLLLRLTNFALVTNSVLCRGTGFFLSLITSTLGTRLAFTRVVLKATWLATGRSCRVNRTGLEATTGSSMRLVVLTGNITPIRTHLGEALGVSPTSTILDAKKVFPSIHGCLVTSSNATLYASISVTLVNKTSFEFGTIGEADRFCSTGPNFHFT